MDRKEKILNFIKSDEYIPMTEDELMMVLVVPKEDSEEFKKILSSLLSEGRILKSKKGRYSYNSSKKTIEGIISCNSRGFFAFLVPDDESESDVYIHGDALLNAMHGDRVLVSVDKIDTVSQRPEGHITKILERKTHTISGVLKKSSSKGIILRPDSPKIYYNFSIPEDMLMGATSGDRVLIEITKYPPEACGVVTNILGDGNSLKSLENATLFSENISLEFSEDVINEANQIPDKISPEAIKGRLDLRDTLTFTIDGDDARDFDDAVSLTILENGNYRLGVHIADVTHYVKKGSPLDTEAYKRGTSIYLPDRVIPMLPEKLSNGICSLNPNEDRLTLSVFMEISKKGVVLSNEIYESVICSKERMTYTNVEKLLNKEDEELLKRYDTLLPTLENMKELAKILRGKRMDEGSIDFDFPEAKIVVDKEGNPIEIYPEERLMSHKIIEEFMLSANRTVAEYAFWAELPFVFRSHLPPSTESMRDYQKFLASFGLGLKESFSDAEPIHPKTIQDILNKVSGTDEEHIIATYTLRSLMKADYKSDNTGHFGLAANYYCHFTSPIRRYPDLAIHRILKAFIKGESIDEFYPLVSTIAKHSSDTEKTAVLLERDISDLMMAYYMSQYVGYVFEAKISSITDFGIFAELENTVEGLIRLENIRDDFYIYDAERKTLTGKHTNKVYSIGDSIDIAVARCDLMSRQIDFLIAEDLTMSDIDRFQKREYKKKRELDKKRKNKTKSISKRKRKRF